MLNRLSPFAVLALAACAQTPGEISRDTTPFDGISDTATITLLGTEPFWGLDIKPGADGYAARLSTPEDIDGSQFNVARFAGNNGLGFNGQLEDRDVHISITPGDCSDGMSDRSYPYIATVALGESTLLGCGYTSEEPFVGEETP